jgi:signal transduction histidine kinase/HPt (histidine-containing phosphotransfer) domain-containing protein
VINVQELLTYTSDLTLLYVEDDDSIRDLNHDIFIEFFQSVTIAKDGQEGLMKYLQYLNDNGNAFDIVITDIRMPKMSGISMSRLIKEKFSDQVIIALSAHQDAHYLFELINMGISYFLPKPVSTQSLYEMLFKTSQVVYNRNVAQTYTKELNRVNEQLESKVVELKDALQKVKEVTEFKDRFLANMSHEIRTPMNAIIGLSHILLHSSLQPEQEENVKKIESSSKMLLQIINDILDFSKIEAGKLELENIEFDLNSVISHLSSIINITALSKNIELAYNINDDVPQFFIGDPTRLGQILLNLMTNAVKFTHNGRVTLNITLLNRHLDSSTLKFEVIDEGIGIDEDKLETLFDSFIQEDNSTTRKYGGSGLGLSIVKQLVSIMNGTIEVSSKKNSGSTFCVTLTLPTLASLTKELKVHNTITNIILTHKTILLVEDNEINRHVIINFLQNSGCRVLIAMNGVEAIEIVKNEEHIDLILMDINMPVMDGYEATHHIREILGFTSIPIIGLSANAMQKDIDKALSIGMNDYISKPINIDEFYTTLVTYIDNAVLNYKECDENIECQNSPPHPFSSVSGLNFEDAMERMEGNSLLYEKVLFGFFTMFKDSTQAIKEALNDEDYDTAYKLNHNIKGSSGNISAVSLYEISVAIEDAITAHDKATALVHLNHFDQEFTQLLDTINTIKKGNI